MGLIRFTVITMIMSSLYTNGILKRMRRLRASTGTIFRSDLNKCNAVQSSVNILGENNDSFLFGDNPTKFCDLGLSTELASALQSCGKSIATSVQVKTFQKILDGDDVVIAAETGSGKTLAYLLPLIEKCLSSEEISLLYPRAIVLVPNKELCRQVLSMGKVISTELELLGRRLIIGEVSPLTQQLLVCVCNLCVGC